jgi:hypothetical protein
LIFGFVLSVLLVPGIQGAATAPRWAFAAVMLPLIIPSRKTEFILAHLFGLIFLGYAAISVTWSHHYDGLDALFKLIVIAEAFVLGSKLDDLKPVIIGIGLGVWVSSLVILAGIDVPRADGNAVGLFVNSNVLGEIAGLILVAACFHRIWWLVPGILPAFLMAGCRGAFVAVAGVFVLWLRRKSLGGAIIIVGLCVVGIYLSMGNPNSVNQRLQMWSDVLPHLTLLGSGLGSYFTLFPLQTTVVDTLALRPEHLHNDWLEYVFETGIGSLFLFGVLWLSRSIVLACLFIEACFGFPLHMAATAVLGGIVAGHGIRDRHSLRHDLAIWRISLRARSQRAASKSRHRRVEEIGGGIPA